ncbi:MAG: sugar phosphate isomerase/epimerase [Armatimonadetes bacterium]|nr:sugar phosphate isomerase/epimerase [Armatimonadota bacterium]
MKLAVSMWCYVRAVKGGRLDLCGFVREAARIGADGVELLDFFYQDAREERPRVFEALSEAGLPCPIFSVANNFVKTTAQERAEQTDRIRFGVDEAVYYGASTVRVFAGDAAEGVTFDDARTWIVDGLAEAADYARDKGVRLALENHGRLAGQSGQVRGLIEEVRSKTGHDALGANPDTGNFLLVGQDPVQAVAELAGTAAMVHFKDFAPGDGHYVSSAGTRFQGTVIGEGTVDLGGCVAALRAGGFEGWMSLEYEGDGDPFGDVERSARNCRTILG